MQNKSDRAPVLLTHSVGWILRKERNSRRLSVKDVAHNTSISFRYIEAMERDDFNIFPSEMYAIGFLGNYADYLNLSQDRLIALFRQQQLDNQESPIQQLTKPNAFAGLQRIIHWNPSVVGKSLGLVSFVVIISFISYNWLSFPFFQSPSDESQTVGTYCSGERELRVFNLPLEGSPPRSENLSLNPADSLRMTVDGVSLKFCLFGVTTIKEEVPVGTFHVRIDDKYNYEFKIGEGESFILGNHIELLEGLSRKVKFTSAVLSDYSVRVEIGTLEASTAQITNIKPSVTGATKKKLVKPTQYYQNDIQVTLEFIKDSYVEWTKDGEFHNGRVIPAKEIHTYEALNRLEIKVGNGGGVRIRREGVKPRIAGPIASIVKLEYRRIPDPLDPGISKIIERVEVAQ